MGRVWRASASGRSAKADALPVWDYSPFALFRLFRPRMTSLPRQYAQERLTSHNPSEFLDTMNACKLTIVFFSVQCKRFDGFWHFS